MRIKLVRVCKSMSQCCYFIQGSSWSLINVCGVFDLNIDLETRYASIVRCVEGKILTGLVLKGSVKYILVNKCCPLLIYTFLGVVSEEIMK
jgi:hypothetical protein